MIDKIINYAKRFGSNVERRLGFVLDRLNVDGRLLSELKNEPMKSFCKLDPGGERRGIHNNKWMILENI